MDKEKIELKEKVKKLEKELSMVKDIIHRLVCSVYDLADSDDRTYCIDDYIKDAYEHFISDQELENCYNQLDKIYLTDGEKDEIRKKQKHYKSLQENDIYKVFFEEENN